MYKKIIALMLCFCVLLLCGCEEDSSDRDSKKKKDNKWEMQNAFQKEEDDTPADEEDPLAEDEDTSVNENETQEETEVKRPPVKVGVYAAGNGNDTFTVHAVGNQTIVFTVFWYRTFSLDEVTAVWDGTCYTFDWEEEWGNYANGTITFPQEGTVQFCLTEAQLPYIETGETVFTFIGSEEDRAGQLSLEALLLNNDEYGWQTKVDDEDEEDDDIYLRFYADGRADLWYMDNNLIEGTPSHQAGSYRVEGTTIYINGDAYELYAYGGGVPSMSLQALGDYDMDYSGEYSFVSDYVYTFFYEHYADFVG